MNKTSTNSLIFYFDKAELSETQNYAYLYAHFFPGTRVGVIKIVIVINCNLITFSKVIACNCN